MTRIRTFVVFAVVALSLARVEAQTTKSAGSDCKPPSYKTVKQVAYPLETILLHETGKTIIKLTVGVNGLPTDLTIHASSGSEALDQAALSAVAGYTFVPATCDDKPKVSPALVPVAFSLHEFEHDALKFEKDNQALEFAEVGKEIDFLNSRPDTQRGSVLDYNVFYDPKESLMWLVRKADATPKAVMRIRSEYRADSLYQNYAMDCDGKKDWCEQQRAQFLDFAKKFPAPKNEKSAPK